MSTRLSVNLRLVVGVLLVIFILVLSSPLPAQTAATGALTGTVADSSGAVVPNAAVTATNTDTGQARNTTTGPDGVFKFSLMPPGTYRVRFEAAGFNAVEVPSATVNVTETEVLNETLQVGGQSQEVSVQADVEVIQTASSALGTVVNTQTMTQLPLNTRNYKDLLALSAGANSSVTNATYVGKGSTLIFVNGGSSAQNTFLQDGVVISNWYSLGTGTEGALIGAFAIPNPDTIAEFKIQTSAYDAGYGRNPGANVNVLTKSGSNQFHGTAFEFFRNTVLNANDFFFEYSELAHGQPNKELPINQNQFGGVFGGPIKKDKLFFFTSYQETQQKNGLSGYGYSTVTLPNIPAGDRGKCSPPTWAPASYSTACNAAAQAFVQNLATNFCNATPSQGTVKVQCPGATGAVGPYNINPVAINILQLPGPAGDPYLIPSPTGGSSFQAFSVPVIFKDHQFLGNFDYVINPKNTLSARFEWEDDPLYAPNAVINSTIVSNTLPGSPIYALKANDQAILKLTSILSNSLVNEARISYQRFVSTDKVLSPYTNSSVGIAKLGTLDTLSPLTVTPNFTLGGYTGYGAYLPEDQFEWADQVSWTHGKHSIRTGFDAERVEVDHIYPSQSIGTLTAATFQDFLIGRCANVSGCALSNGGTSQPNVSPAGNTNSTFTYEYRVTQLDAFGQDDFKLNSRLTLNLGLRWEYDGFITDKFGNITNIWPSLISTTPAPGTGCVLNGVAVGAGAAGTGCSLAGFVIAGNYNGPLPGGLFKNTNNSPTPHGAPKDDFAPRLGFAWQPAANGRWVVRGGAGFFYDQLGGQTTGDPMSITSPGVGTVPSAAAAPTSTLSNPWIFPATIPGPAGSYGFTPRWVNPATNGSSNLAQTVIQEHLTVPVTYGWNLNTQYEFLPTWVLELGYVGTHGIHNAATSMSGGQGNATTVTYNQAQLAGVGAPCQSCSLYNVTTNTTANVPLRVPNPGIAANDISLSSLASYKYNSAQVTIRKQMSHGLQMQAAYTWSRALQSYPEGINTYPYLAYLYGPNAYYHPQRLVINYVWNLPVSHVQGFLGTVTNGWTLSGVTTVQDGTPLTIVQNANVGAIFGVTSGLAQFCPGMTRANVATSGSLIQRVVSGLATPGAPGSGYLNGGPGYAAGKTACGLPSVVFGPEPTLGAINGVGGGTGYGNSGLGLVLGPGQFNWDMTLSKVTKILHESQSVEFRGEFFNAFNHPQFGNPNLTVNASTFGQISNTSVNPRIIQLALKYSF